ncbi:hypothetical protein PBY51_018782 [Eleginops maclovinus]|uniref:IRF tryptophan pentad repeat domain-containing protein n=1 Tax=Eleginops maclovinus TaxID=56733 RepID=A0AAN7Y4G9_ELEMC|nr:hypothetical protein PBY51_018782 [Eleginops maclovinus]
MHPGRLRLRPWLEEQIESGNYPGVSWLDQAAQIFQIPWKHAARHIWSIDQDATLFRSWAMHTDLAPSTTYWVSVKSFTTWSNKFSDSSQECEFTTPMSSNSLAVTIVISLCIAAIIISAALYGCCIKLKTKWLETAAKCPNPKLLPMRSSEQEVLKPAPLVISSVWVDSVDTEDSKWLEWSLKDPSCGSPLQSSGINTGSSCLSYANTEPADIIARVQDALGLAFPEIRPMSPLITNALTETNKDSGLPSTPYKPCDVRAEDTSVGSYSFDNETYSCLLPNFAHQIVMDCSDVKAEIPCDSEYLHNTSTMVPCVDKQALACPLFHLPPQDPSLMPIDMSYQQNNADSWGVSHAEDSSLSSVSSGTNTIASWDHMSGVKSDSEGFDEAIHDATKGPIICDENPSYGAVPAGLQSLPPVYDDYQPFQSLVEQPCYSFTEEKRGEEEDHLNKYPEETFPKMPQSFLGPVASGVINNVQCPPNLQRQLLAVIPADQSMPIITDSDYHSV